MGLRCEVTHLVDYWAKLDFWGGSWLLCHAEAYHWKTLVTILPVVSCDNRGCGAFRLLFSFKKLTPFASQKGNGFCFHSLVARPVDHIDHGGTQTRHEAFWTHSCVFHSSDSGKHMLNSHQSLKRVWLWLPLFFFSWATHSVVFLHWAITNLLRLSTQLSLEECTVSKPCRLLDFVFPPLLLSLLTFGFIYIFCCCLSSFPWLSPLHPGRMKVTEHYTSYHGRQARCHSKEPSSCELPVYIAEVTFYTKGAIAVI